MALILNLDFTLYEYLHKIYIYISTKLFNQIFWGYALALRRQTRESLLTKLEENETLAVHPVSAMVIHSVASNKFPLHTSSAMGIGWADPISALLLARILVLIVRRATMPPFLKNIFLPLYSQRRSFWELAQIISTNKGAWPKENFSGNWKFCFLVVYLMLYWSVQSNRLPLDFKVCSSPGKIACLKRSFMLFFVNFLLVSLHHIPTPSSRP